MEVMPKGVAIARSKIGNGVFATKRYRTGQTIARIPGRVVDYRMLLKRGGAFMNNCIRFGPETYLDPQNGLGRFLNHSCDPSAAIAKRNNQLFVFAARTIARGEEITFDYSTTIGDDDIWTMRCHCGAPRCRGRVRRFGSLPEAVREEYIRRGMVPGYILRTLSSRA